MLKQGFGNIGFFGIQIGVFFIIFFKWFGDVVKVFILVFFCGVLCILILVSIVGMFYNDGMIDML